ncbi:MAG: hypothetical protein H6Q68_2207 [Firmicutes bacterium]|nr:hypothetical protein [Bacillota bacterium]
MMGKKSSQLKLIMLDIEGLIPEKHLLKQLRCISNNIPKNLFFFSF